MFFLCAVTVKLVVAVTGLEGQGNGTFTHLVELDPLFVPLGCWVGDPQGSELSSEQVGGVPLHG